MARIIGVYALLGPIVGALLYVGLSALVGALGVRSNVFIDPALLGSASQTLGLASWQVALSAPFSLSPALLTGWLTARRIASQGSCPWWLSCLYGGVISGLGGFVALVAAKSGYPDLPIIPNPVPGAALIAFIGFVGTWPCWWVVARRDSPLLPGEKLSGGA